MTCHAEVGRRETHDSMNYSCQSREIEYTMFWPVDFHFGV